MTRPWGDPRKRANFENSVSLEDTAAGSLVEWICPMTLAGLPVGERREALRDARKAFQLSWAIRQMALDISADRKT